MVRTMTPSFGGSGSRNIPVGGGRAAAAAGTTGILITQGDGSRRASATPRFRNRPGDVLQQAQPQGQQQWQQQQGASAFYFTNGEDVVVPAPAAPRRPPSTPAQRDALPTPAPAEPGGSKEGGDAFQSSYDRPWRKRARSSQRNTVFENKEGGLEVGFEAAGSEGSGGAMRRRLYEKEEMLASRKESQKKALNRAALPLVDLVGIVSPLVLIVGISLAQNAP